jgi:hypothetical protein
MACVRWSTKRPVVKASPWVLAVQVQETLPNSSMDHMNTLCLLLQRLTVCWLFVVAGMRASCQLMHHAYRALLGRHMQFPLPSQQTTRVCQFCGCRMPSPAVEAVPGHTTMLRTQATSAAPAAGSAAGRRHAVVLPALDQQLIPPTDREQCTTGLWPAELVGGLPAPVPLCSPHTQNSHMRLGLGTHSSVDDNAHMPPCMNPYLEETL